MADDGGLVVLAVVVGLAGLIWSFFRKTEPDVRDGTPVGRDVRVNRQLQMSPGKATAHRFVRLDAERQRRAISRSTVQAKKRRVELKRDRAQDGLVEMREGVTYKGEVGLDNASPVPSYIPDPVCEPLLTRIRMSQPTYIVFDLETTGLDFQPDIVQVSASTLTQAFDQYVLPTKPMSAGAAEVTGLTFKNDTLYKDNQPQSAISCHQALTCFLDFLFQYDDIILVGHNIFKFDLRVLILACEKHNLLAPLKEKVTGFIDTLPLSKVLYPDRSSYKQKDLVTDILDMEYEAHNAAADVKSLRQLFDQMGASLDVMSCHSMTCVSAIDRVMYQLHTHINLQTFSHVISSKVLSAGMARKAAASGLQLSHMQLAWDRNNIDGIHGLFTEICDLGKPRVTKNQKIIDSVCTYFNSQQDIA